MYVPILHTVLCRLGSKAGLLKSGLMRNDHVYFIVLFNSADGWSYTVNPVMRGHPSHLLMRGHPSHLWWGDTRRTCDEGTPVAPVMRGHPSHLWWGDTHRACDEGTPITPVMRGHPLHLWWGDTHHTCDEGTPIAPVMRGHLSKCLICIYVNTYCTLTLDVSVKFWLSHHRF